ncbi:MAG: radical SAM protein, partial [Clostridia bacterium]|nr:radical SAM protein [Clostridia bacterium]
MRISVVTLGCKVNQYESDSLISVLKNQGHEVFSHLQEADIYIINTCAVTNEAEKKSRQTVAKCRSLNPYAKILVCGCASEKNVKQFQDLQNVTFISGVANKLALANNLENIGVNVESHSKYYDDNYVSIPTKTRAYIKIQDGCNNFCSYCIIPYLRGRSRSRNIISILNEVNNLSQIVKEIVITGIDISDYKVDDEKALSVLIEQLQPYQDIRFRLGSLEQGVVDNNLIEACKKVHVCPHFHLSLQSGCNTV